MGNYPSRRCFAGCDNEAAIAAIVSMVTIIKADVVLPRRLFMLDRIISLFHIF